MRCLVTSSRPYDRDFLTAANASRHDLVFIETPLRRETAEFAKGFPAVCAFVDDTLNRDVLQILSAGGCRLLALRSTGFNHVDLSAAADLGITVMRVRNYSPYAVAEFALSLMLTLNRRVHKAYNRVREGNFLLDGLLGFDMHGKTVGLIGTGKIGTALARILHGMGCRLLGYDPVPNEVCRSLGMQYVSPEVLLAESQIISLHVPLTPETYHFINAESLRRMPSGAILINTSRGALVDTAALIESLKQHHIGAVGLDVYEEEAAIYFQNLTDEIIHDDLFARLITFPNVMVTGHQAFFTVEAIRTIAQTTIANLDDFASGRPNENIVSAAPVSHDTDGSMIANKSLAYPDTPINE
jgi:D-lactate dehydrogenase